MKTATTTTTLLLVLLMISGIAQAEGRFGQWEGGFRQKSEKRTHKGHGGHEAFIGRLVSDKKLADQIGLSQEQAEHIQDELYKVQLKMVDLQADFQKAGMEQARLLSAETIDEKALIKAIEKTGSIRTKIAKLRIRPLLLIKSSLDPEQLQQARKQMRVFHQKRRHTMKDRMDQQRRKWGNKPGFGYGNQDGDRRPRWMGDDDREDDAPAPADEEETE